MFRPGRRSRLCGPKCTSLLLLLAAVLLQPRLSFAQECRADLTADMQVWVHAINFKIRYFDPPDLPLKTNSIFAPDVLSASQDAIRRRLSDDDNKNEARAFANLGF